MVWGHKNSVKSIFKTVKKSLKRLYQGIDLYVKDLDKTINVRGILMSGTCDLPAKAIFLSMTQYNGKFECQVCIHPGCTVDKTRTYHYEETLILRTDNDTLEHSVQALEIGMPVCGV